MKQSKGNGRHTEIGMLILFAMLSVMMLPVSQALAVTDYIGFSVNGDTTATSMVPGDEISWRANCEVGASLLWEIWYDVDESGDIDEMADASIVSFVAVDGDTSSDGPPPDIDPIPDGMYISAPMTLGLPPGQYIFRVTDLSDDTQVAGGIEVMPLVAPAQSFVGRIVVTGHPAPDADVLQWVWVEANFDDGGQMWSAFTDENGDFTIDVGDAGAGLTFRVEPAEISGFVRPASQEAVATGTVVLDDFVYLVPADSVYGTVTDENGDPLPMPVYVYASSGSGGDQKNTETVDGDYVLYFGPSELGEWWVGVSSEDLIPNYLVPQSVTIDNSSTSDIQLDFECLTADTVLYVLVTEDDAEPTHQYMIEAFCQSDGFSTHSVSGTGSGNLVELHISSLYDADWSVQTIIWDSAYFIPEGYFLESTTTTDLSPGDTVHLNFVSGTMVRDTITVDPGDPIPDWNMISVNMWDGLGGNYGTQPDANGVFTLYADTGTYSLNVSISGYYALPSLRSVHVTEDTTGGLGFLLNQTHCRVSGSLQGATLPLSGYMYVMVSTDGIGLAATVDTMTGSFSLDVFDGDWVFTPPYIDGYGLPDTIHLIIGESPDTLRTANFTYSPILGIETGDPDGLPKSFVLGQNHPNPFNPSTSIEYSLPVSSRVTIEVFNLLGQQVRTLVDEVQGPGTFRAEWNGMDAAGQPVASGIYLYRLEADSYLQTRKMMLLK